MKKIENIAILVAENRLFEALRRQFPSYKFLREGDHFLFETDYKGLKISLLETGMGIENIDRRISRILEKRLDLAIFLGLIGALDKDMKVGEVVIPSRFTGIYNLHEEYRASPELLDLCESLRKKNNLRLRLSKKNISVDRVYLRDDKIRLKELEPDASSVDMEAFVAAKRFSKEKIPFVVAKAISDERDFSFPDFEFFSARGYKKDLAKLFFYCIKYPQETSNLINFIRNARKAFKNDIGFLKLFLDTLAYSPLLMHGFFDELSKDENK
ncbi:MAG: hypothetical protein AMJ95_02380 [Omnitrophica WOR_2 bacterium SM23_72]|nr:MAG: hypothetical protein AMJ95_02380 [Omnitrophica WOR_2 bacterium SM23_72]